jgi:hypothetical protein
MSSLARTLSGHSNSQFAKIVPMWTVGDRDAAPRRPLALPGAFGERALPWMSVS